MASSCIRAVRPEGLAAPETYFIERGSLEQGRVVELARPLRPVAPTLLSRSVPPLALGIQVLSDLHLECGEWTPPNTFADVVALAGDIVPGEHGLAWARERFPHKPIVYVLGNHEFHCEEMESLLPRARAEAYRLGIHLLEADEVVIAGVRFLGCRDIYLQRRVWLTERLAEPFAGRTVVVTHHVPHLASIGCHSRFRPLDLCFVSHVPELVRRPVDLWIHGHTHHSSDYVVNGTRVVCNPRGCAPDALNGDFNPALVVEI